MIPTVVLGQGGGVGSLNDPPMEISIAPRKVEGMKKKEVEGVDK